MAGLQVKTEAGRPKLCRSMCLKPTSWTAWRICHMGIREPVKLTRRFHVPQRQKTDEYALAFTSHPEPDLLKNS